MLLSCCVFLPLGPWDRQTELKQEVTLTQWSHPPFPFSHNAERRAEPSRERLRAALFITQPLCFRHVTDFAETWFGGSWGPEMTPRHLILGSCWVKSGFRGHFPERGSKIQDSFFGRSLFIVQCIKKLHFIFQQDLWPSSAHVEGQLCSSKDVDSTALASSGRFWS